MIDFYQDFRNKIFSFDLLSDYARSVSDSEIDLQEVCSMIIEHRFFPSPSFRFFQRIEKLSTWWKFDLNGESRYDTVSNQDSFKTLLFSVNRVCLFSGNGRQDRNERIVDI